MAKFTVTFARTARKELELLPSNIVERIFPKIEALGDDPRPRGVKKLEGEDNMWRIRVGDYRNLYSISDKRKVVDISGVKARGDAYR